FSMAAAAGVTGSTAADLTFATTSTIDDPTGQVGTAGLTVNGTNTATFAGVVGGSVAISSLTNDAGGTTVLSRNVSTATNSGGTTTGSQTYNDVVSLGAGVTLSGLNVTFATTLDSLDSTPRSLTVNTTGSGVTTFGGGVGGTFALASLTTDSGVAD